MEARRALTAFAGALCLAAGLAGCGCGGASALQGKWSRIHPVSNAPLGDVLTIEGKGWSLTGFPPMSGTVEQKEGHFRLVIEKVGDQTRQEALKTPGANNVEEALKGLDGQLVFDVVTEDGATRLKQVGKGAGFAEWRFQRQK